ncbi:MAG TPA: hypothetical protein VIJ00_12835, partial [Nakamurella sp.]
QPCWPGSGCPPARPNLHAEDGVLFLQDWALDRHLSLFWQPYGGYQHLILTGRFNSRALNEGFRDQSSTIPRAVPGAAARPPVRVQRCVAEVSQGCSILPP